MRESWRMVTQAHGDEDSEPEATILPLHKASHRGASGISSDFTSAINRLVQVYESDVQKLEEQLALHRQPKRISTLSSSTHEASQDSEKREEAASVNGASLMESKNEFKLGATPESTGIILPPVSRSSCITHLNIAFTVRKEWTEEKISASFRSFRDLARSGSMSLDVLLSELAQRGEILSKPKELGISRYCCCIMNPSSYKRAAWDIICMICLVWDCVTVPFILTFDPEPSTTMHVLTLTTTIFWTVDIVIGFLTGYQISRNDIMMDPAKVALHYLCTGFPLDIIVVAVDWTFVIGESGTKGSAARLGRSIRVLKLFKTLKLLRTMKLKKYIRAVQDMITSETVSICFGITRVIFVLLLVNHVVACLWYLIGDLDCHCGQPGWVEKQNMKAHELSYQYVSSLHWALAQFTPAPNEIFPNNFNERLFATIVLMGALVSFSAVTGTITAGVMQMKNMSSEESRAFWQLRRYLREWKIPLAFRRRVVSYLEYAYGMERKRIQEKDVGLLNLLSEQLQFQLRQMTLKEHLHQHPLFYRLHYSTLAFIKALGTRPLAEGDIVSKCGEEASEMLFITSGHIEYMKPLRSTEVGKYESKKLFYGDWMCEMVLWTSHWISLGHAVSERQCSVITIHGKDFCKSIQRNVDLWTRVQLYATKYVEDLNRLPRSSLSDLGDIFEEFNHENFLDEMLPRPNLFSAHHMEGTVVEYVRDLMPRRLRNWICRPSFPDKSQSTHQSKIQSCDLRDLGESSNLERSVPIGLQ